MTAALTVVGETALAREPAGLDMVRGLDDALRLVEALKDAGGFLPAWVRSPGQALAVILAGREMGIPPLRAFRVIYSIEGKIELSAPEMLSLLMRGGVRVEWLRCDHEVATARFTRQGYPSHEETYSMDDAKRAGLAGKGTWLKYPKSMLRARCVSTAARYWAPDLLGNAYAEGEIQETYESEPASSGSRAVRDLDNAIHEVDPAPIEADPLEHAMYALTQCRTDADLRSWVRAFSEKVERESDTARKRDRWVAIKKAGASVTPPVRTAPLTALFAEMRAERAKRGAPIEGEVERDPLDELASVETREGLFAWGADHRAWLTSPAAGSETASAMWRAIEDRAAAIGDRGWALELEGELS